MNLNDLNISLEKIAGSAQALNESRARANRAQNPAWLRRMAEAKRLTSRALGGDEYALLAIREAASISDYPLLQGDNLAREMRALYNEYPADWRGAAQVATVPDFRDKKIFPRGTVDQAWTKNFPPAAGDTSNKADQTAITYAVDVYTNHIMVNWKTIVNDDLGHFATLPQELARGARRTELKLFTETHWGSTGPANLTQLTSNPVLGVAGLKAALTQMLKTQDANGEPILVQAPILEIGPGLVIDARELINATMIELKTSTDIAAGRNLMTENWVNSFITQVLVNPYVPKVATTNGDTSWNLLANSSQGPAAIEMGYLRGMTEPQLMVRASDAQLLGGGLQSSTAFGSFHGQNIEYKGLLVIGGKVRDSKLGFMSNGTGS